MEWVIGWISRFLPLLVCLSLARAEGQRGWTFHASFPSCYQAELDASVCRRGKRSAHLRSLGSASAHTYALYYQKIHAGAYRGQRVRLSGYLRTSEVSGWAGLWMRVDPKDGGPSLAFENMLRQPVLGSSDWKQYSIEVDVPEEAKEIDLGTVLSGRGEVWFDDLELSSVAVLVPGAAELRRVRHLPGKPYNLDFEAE